MTEIHGDEPFILFQQDFFNCTAYHENQTVVFNVSGITYNSSAPGFDLLNIFNGTDPCHVVRAPFFIWFWAIGGVCAVVASLMSFWVCYKHLLHFNYPTPQKYIIRIIIMVPIYAIDSWLSMVFYEYSLYWNVARDCYEAYVLFLFYKLLVEFADGEEELAFKLERVPQMKYSAPLCCFHIKPGRIFLHRCAQMILQFVYCKIALAIIVFMTELFNKYHEGDFSPRYAYLYVTIVYNISITLSLYFLVLFYEATKEILAEYKPIAKFLTVKAIIFFSFWQSLAISILSALGWIPEVEGVEAELVAIYIGNLLLCIEMIPIAGAFFYTFSYSSFKVDHSQRVLGNETPAGVKMVGILSNFKSVLNVTDIFADSATAMRKEPERNVQIDGVFDLSQLTRDQIIHQGWLKKKGEDLAKMWKTRWCILLRNPYGIVYFKENPNTAKDAKKAFEARGWVDFTDVTDVVVKRKSGFNINTTYKTWRFNCADIPERDLWMDYVHDLIKEHKQRLAAEAAAAAAATPTITPGFVVNPDSLPGDSSPPGMTAAINGGSLWDGVNGMPAPGNPGFESGSEGSDEEQVALEVDD